MTSTDQIVTEIIALECGALDRWGQAIRPAIWKSPRWM